MTSTYTLHQISFLFLTKLFFGNYKKMLFTVILVTLIPFLIYPSFMAHFILKFYVVFFVGLFLSYIIHEYLHIWCLKRSREEGEIVVEFSLMKISLYPQFELSKGEMLKVALLPALMLPIVGLGFVSIGTWMEQTFLTLTGYIYILHVINILPPLGDGIMILKALLTNNSA
ncbi:MULTISPECIES: metalloprotease family protein [unclassified Bacillus (in: firmicutes)]|uniref:metalloprotease family protein n=1 Tax=unclassified Bacillus (in: firmicutes) TaxID=185979 RepID=UPI001BE98D7B|nr:MULTISPECIES: metalloprotease family protein [unclassified Bacillus (in: firmicutes)]MBT2617763.1 DUF3267 domain-containing protein [Bacillus sp. ISL-78]MBT2629586.1 DUF3267 domain-containing protein [Bacillus sp. ISL-101]